MPSITLQDRAFIAVSGAEAEDFLQGIITTDVPAIGAVESWPGALLTPQGKIMFEFMISRGDEVFLIETSEPNGAALAKRLTLYKLRAQVTITKSDEQSVTVSWDVSGPINATRDMRFAKAGIDVFRVPGAKGEDDTGAYAALKIINGISGGAEDGDAGEFFPHDLMMDRNGGINFKKGCYVGQEVVSRMQHRSTARRRLVTVAGASALPEAGTPILINGREIGALRTVEGTSGLAVVRIDKAGEAIAGNVAITIGEQAVTLALPIWSGVAFPTAADEAAS